MNTSANPPAPRASWKARLRARYRPAPPDPPEAFWSAFRARAESLPQREAARAWVGAARRRTAWAAATAVLLLAAAGLWRGWPARPDGPRIEVVAFADRATSCMVWQDPDGQGIIVWLVEPEPPEAAGG